MSEQISAIAAFDEIIIKLLEPPVVSAAAREIAAQLRALADTVWAGRDEQVRGGTSMAMTEDERELVFELSSSSVVGQRMAVSLGVERSGRVAKFLAFTPR